MLHVYQTRTNSPSHAYTSPLPPPSSPVPPPPGHCWFEFNDTRVGPALEQSIEKMFQGKQSAYMLFYRRASLTRPSEGNGINIHYYWNPSIPRDSLKCHFWGCTFLNNIIAWTVQLREVSLFQFLYIYYK